METIDEIIEICIDFRKDMLKTGNELLKNVDEEEIVRTITHAFYILGFKKNGWSNFSPYDYYPIFIKEKRNLV